MHLPAPAGAGARVPPRRGGSCRTCADLGVSHLYLSPVLQARAGSTHGYDVVDPTRVSEELGGEDEFRALCGAGAGAGLGVVLDIVPNHMAADDENPFWRDPLWRAQFFDLDWRTGSHRRFFDVGELAGVRVEDPEVWELTHREGRRARARGARRRRPRRPSRRARRIRGGTSSGCARRALERVWVEKILEPGERLRADWPVEGTTGYEFLNDVTALFVDPAGEEPLTRLYEEVTGERRPFARGRGARRSSSRRGRPSRTRRRSWRSRLPFEADVERALASLHVYRTYVEPDAGSRGGRGSGGGRARRAAASGCARILLLEERGHDAFVAPLPADDAAGAREGRRGHGVLPLAPARRAQRGRRRSRHGSRSRSPTFHPANLGAAAARACSRRRRTTRSGAATCARGSRASRPIRMRGRRSCGRGSSGWRDPNEAYLDPPDRRRRVAALRRRGSSAYLEKALREAKVNTSWLEPDLEWEAGAKRFGGRAARRRGASARTSRRLAGARRAGRRSG